MGDRPLVARIDPDQFASLLSNLLINALDATPPGGRVRVEGGATPDRRLRVSVSDSGPGIPPELADTLFTPFATTKPAGTGLGLAVARRVAEDHGGTLTAANRPGGGACFTVTLPAAEAADAQAPGR
jgi:signal transduction histidine kinase